MGEILLQALGTVIIGMGIVFAVLILICLIIYCFNIFPYIEGKINEKKANKNQAKETVKAVESMSVQPITDGITMEEIAAIAAAIEAYIGMSQSDFIVRRIVRR